MFINQTSSNPPAIPELSPEDFSRLLLEIRNLAVIMLDYTGKIMSWNIGAELIYGFSGSEIVGKNVQSLYSSNADSTTTGDYLNKALESERHEYTEWQQRKDGTLFLASITLTPLWQTDGTLKGFSHLTNDITLQKRLEQENRVLQNELEERVRQRTRELEVVNKELEAFSYSVSHDLRAPLRAIIGFSKILIDDYENVLDKEGQRYLNNIFRNADVMGQLIDDLLKFSKMSRLEVIAKSVNMARLVDRTIQQMLPAMKKEYSFKVYNLPPCRGDESMLKQVWINLIDNAIKYSSKTENPIIEIGAKKQGKDLQYYITDNGVGFDMKYASKLFGVFQRLHSHQEFEGTGLGLAFIQRIIHKHNGEVRAESQPGMGATFYFTIPD